MLDADKEKLTNAPKVEGKNYQRLYTRSEAEPIFVYWKVTWIEPRFQSVIIKPPETKSMNTTEQRTGAATLLAASEIKGVRVINFQNQDVGDIDELLIEPDTGEIRFAVVSVGGFLGFGSTKVAVPWMALQIVNERGRVK